MSERQVVRVNGPLLFVVLLVFAAVDARLWVAAFGPAGLRSLPSLVAAVLLGIVVVLVASGFTVIQPNQSRVVTLFGTYLGTMRRNGWFWTVPLTLRKNVSLRVQNFDSEVLKVNDAAGNPVEIAAIVVWRVVNTARAAFDVEDYAEYVRIQAETAIRDVASRYPYESYDDAQLSLRANADEVTESLQREMQLHLELAGIEILDTRFRRLAYAPEIAADMLRRQQAEAVVAARHRIVEGAVGMVDMALRALQEGQIVDLDEDKKAAMVSNLLVVLTGESRVQPVVNAGTLYQ